jgi:plasmid stabilization system protein ParE
MKTSSRYGWKSPRIASRWRIGCWTRWSDAWRQIAEYPYSGIAREDIAPGIRRLVVGQYLTLYRVTGEAIEIIRVLYGRQRISRKSVE